MLVPLSTRNLNAGYYAPVIILIIFVLCASLYLSLAIVGILRKNSPYYTPFLSSLHFTSQLFATLDDGTGHSTHFQRTSGNFTQVRKATEESAQRLSQGLDRRTLEWTFNSLNQDREFERFFAGIPDFCNSRVVEDPMGHILQLDGEQKLSQALIGFMHRTVTSHLISEQSRQQRITICTKAIDAMSTLASWTTLRRVFGEWEGLLGSADFGSAILRTVQGGDPSKDPCTVFCARCIVAIVIARAQVYDDSWFNLATQFLTSDMEVWAHSWYYRLLTHILNKVLGGISPTHRDYLKHGHSTLLANLIFTARVIFRFHSEHSRDKLFDVSSRTLSELSSNIDVHVQLASSDIQHKFCGLWNELVHQAQAQNGTGSYTTTITADILKHLRNSYIVLHESTDTSLFYTSTDNHAFTGIPLPSSSYPLCNVQNHHRPPPQTPHLDITSISLASPPPSHSLLNVPPDNLNAFPPNAVASATEGTNSTSNVSSQTEVTSDLAASPSARTAPRSPLAACPY